MQFRLVAAAMTIILAGLSGCKQQTAPTTSAETWTARGQVSYLDREPGNDIVVAKYWSSNGKLWGEDGNVPQNLSEDALKMFWANEGTMEAYPHHSFSLDNGKFVVENPLQHSCVALALNAERTHGGIAISTSETAEPMDIVMKPLVRIHGLIRCAGETPEWTNVYVHYPNDQKKAPD